MKKIVKPKIGAFKVGSKKPKQILRDNPKRESFLIYNNGTEYIELLSTPHQKYGDGIPIPPGVQYESDTATGSFWLIAKNGEQDVRIEEDVED